MIFRSQLVDEIDQVVDEGIHVEDARTQRHVADVVPVGDVDVVMLEQRARGAGQQRGKVAGNGGDQQDLGAGVGRVLAEVQQRGEWSRGKGFFAYGNLAPVHFNRLNAEARPLVGQARQSDGFADGGRLAHGVVVRHP